MSRFTRWASVKAKSQLRSRRTSCSLASKAGREPSGLRIKGSAWFSSAQISTPPRQPMRIISRPPSPCLTLLRRMTRIFAISAMSFLTLCVKNLGKKIVALRKQSFPRPFLNPQRKAAHLPMIRIRLPAGLPPCILNCAKCIKPILKNTATFLRRSSSVSMARRLQCKRFGKMINNV